MVKGKGSRKKEKTKDFLLEVGCEELPADYLPGVLDWVIGSGIGAQAAEVLTAKKVSWQRIQTFGTPRRLVLFVSGVESDIEEVIEGPPASVAFDAKCQPTEAAKGFAKRQGVPLSQLKRKVTSRGERLVFERKISVVEVLGKAIPEILQAIPFPKTMRWDDSGFRFARPVRWLLALYGTKPIPCILGKIQGDRITYGSSQHRDRAFRVSSTASYLPILSHFGIQLEDGGSFEKTETGWKGAVPSVRRKRETLLMRLHSEAKKIDGVFFHEESEQMNRLCTTVTFLAEDPVVQSGVFRKEYLDLPSEVLATAMAKYLKLFSVVSKDEKKLLPKFLAVLEGKPTNPRLVMANYERIIEARFSDARLFYQEDTRAPLSAKVPELQKIVFHEKLGSVHDRIPRMERLMAAIAKGIGLQDPIVQLIPRTAQLAKADLVTQMVREFPSLQGVVGGYYAQQEGEPEMIFRAVWEHYRPRVAGDHLPSDPLGSMLALADRLDTLCGYFGIGLKPTGSVDPYGLRRQALGAVRILTEFSFQEKGNVMTGGGLFFRGLSIDRLFDESIQSWGPRLTMEAKALKKELCAFVRERFEWLALPPGDGDRELVAAVLAADDDDLAGARERLSVLRQMWADPQQRRRLTQAAKVAERTGRMVEAAKEADGLPAVDPQIFTDPLERQLWQSWGEVHPRVEEHLKGRRYAQAVVAYGALYPVIHEFFQRVFVMDENMRLRRNRLSLIHEIFYSLSSTFADLSKLPLSGIA